MSTEATRKTVSFGYTQPVYGAILGNEVLHQFTSLSMPT